MTAIENNFMAKFDEENKQIILSEEDRAYLKEQHSKIEKRKTPIADSIIKSIMGKENNER